MAAQKWWEEIEGVDIVQRTKARIDKITAELEE